MPIGGDLAGMQSLASKFEASGADFSSKSSSLASRVEQALGEFVAEMARLHSQAETLSSAMTSEMAKLSAQAESTNWTGSNRVKADQIVNDLATDVGGLQSAIDNFAREAHDIVNGELSRVMNQLRDNATKSGSAALDTASSFATAVTAQRNAFDAVMNG